LISSEHHAHAGANGADLLFSETNAGSQGSKLTDRLTQKQRSALMARIRGRNTVPELAVRRMVHALGYRFRLHRRDLPRTPDLTFPRRRKTILVHGCFWHRHDGFKKADLPKTRRDRMRAKLKEIKEEMRRRRHQPIPEQGKWLRQVVAGFFACHAVPINDRPWGRSATTSRIHGGARFGDAAKRIGRRGSG
jgi:DNA mismatch endonuclease (patch repair protein)